MTQLFPGVLSPPFSFIYGGKNSADLLPGWKIDANVTDEDATRQIQEVAYTDPATGLVVRATARSSRTFPPSSG